MGIGLTQTLRAVRAAIALAVGVAAAMPGCALAQSAATAGCDPATAKAASVQGSVETRRAGDTAWRPVKLGDSFCPGDVIRVQERSRADIALLDQSVLRLNANSTITVQTPKGRGTGVIDLIRGAVHFFSRGPDSLEVNTPYTVAGVRGTEFLIVLEPEQTLLTVFEGTVVAQNASGSLTLTDGQSASAQKGKPPTPRTVVRPRDAVHWALYYPPVVTPKAGEMTPGLLEKSPAGAKDPRPHVVRAHQLLSVGSTDEARAEIGQALKLDPKNADALSLQSIMTLVQGDKDQAYGIAQSAVAAAPNSATALIARSYAEQARFDLPGARASIQRAVEADPNNALAWARLAEMQSSFGELGEATASAEKAAQLQPDLARTQTVLGFAHLIAIRTAQARQAFEKAIALDSADPLPRLGLGLAKIRDGDLDAGSRDIEIAASLDPNNALVRSYLGKAYYEEKRGPRDEREFQVAKQLDPRDPTPWFYDAIQKQTTNRPVEALRDIEKAQALNDNRAVYRSQLLLDSDAAARSASQARIFSDLGFEQRALVEGWSALNRDPTNFSAHRFLADSYSSQPRHEIARVSELLQSQLLAPVTNTPLQPRLAESNLFLISAGGPATASFNEFNPLFTRDGTSILASAMGGQMDTAGGDVVVSHVAGRAAWSVGYSRFQTDGWRPNADQKDEIYTGFFQFDITPQTSVQAEVRKRTNDWGDLKQKFFTDVFSTSLRNSEDTNTLRLGARHTFSQSSVLLASILHQERDATLSLAQPVVFPRTPGVSVRGFNPSESTGAELQHLFRSPRFNLRSGVGYVDADRTANITTTVTVPRPSPPFPPNTTFPPAINGTSSDTGVKHANVYGYGTVFLPHNLNLIVGASYDSIDGASADQDKDQFNPKVGMTWNVTPQTTVRAAWFKALKRTLITDQTLEPTEVAGFNQFYDDASLSESKRYGAAIDQKFSPTMFAGVEVSKRDVTVPWVCVTNCGVAGNREADWEEKAARLYAFWAPTNYLALRAEYVYEQYTRPSEFTGNAARNLDSYRVPLGARFFHPSGFGAAWTTTWWKQKGEFGDNNSFQSGSESFWTTDAAINYRLPKRMGMISIGAANLFDKQFRYLDIDENNPTIVPRRMAFARVSFALP